MRGFLKRCEEFNEWSSRLRGVGVHLNYVWVFMYVCMHACMQVCKYVCETGLKYMSRKISDMA